MAVYEYRCGEGHATDANFPMGEAPPDILCGVRACEATATVAKRVIGNFNFQEDRHRLFRNPQDGSTFSYALGMEHPDNRKDYNNATTALGCEPVTRGTMPAAWKEDREYADHVTHGGERLPNDGHVPKKGNTTVLGQLRKAGTLIP